MTTFQEMIDKEVGDVVRKDILEKSAKLLQLLTDETEKDSNGYRLMVISSFLAGIYGLFGEAHEDPAINKLVRIDLRKAIEHVFVPPPYALELNACECKECREGKSGQHLSRILKPVTLISEHMQELMKEVDYKVGDLPSMYLSVLVTFMANEGLSTIEKKGVMAEMRSGLKAAMNVIE